MALDAERLAAEAGSLLFTRSSPTASRVGFIQALGANMKTSSPPMTVSWWARLLAWVFLAASALAAWGVGREWLQTGKFPVPLSGVAVSLLCGYIFVVLAWVAVTGKVPGFFSLGARHWPFRTPGS
jgi:hypothetical protein